MDTDGHGWTQIFISAYNNGVAAWRRFTPLYPAFGWAFIAASAEKLKEPKAEN